jgi:hypothetical protein
VTSRDLEPRSTIIRQHMIDRALTRAHSHVAGGPKLAF